jgi:tripartite-type tricarboxylate transporter receptor subunit TctC
MTMTRIFQLACIAAIVLAGPHAVASDFPTKPITLILGFSPGGPSDVMGRILARKLEQVVGQSVVVENRAGAGGNIAGEYVARATPDGHTIMLGTNGILAVNASLYRKINFDPAKDFQPITLVGEQPNIIYVHPTVPASSLAELVAYAKANPSKLNFASGGNGTSAHLAGELLKTEAKFNMVHVPMKGTGPALQNVLAGHVQIGISSIAPVIAHIQGGALRPIAVTSLKRSGPLPAVGTVAELMIPGFEATSWHGIVAPAGVSKEVIATLYRAMMTTLNDADVRKRLDGLGIDIIANTPEQFASYIKAEVPKWAAIIKASGATAD